MLRREGGGKRLTCVPGTLGCNGRMLHSPIRGVRFGLAISATHGIASKRLNLKAGPPLKSKQPNSGPYYQVNETAL